MVQHGLNLQGLDRIDWAYSHNISFSERASGISARHEKGQYLHQGVVRSRHHGGYTDPTVRPRPPVAAEAVFPTPPVASCPLLAYTSRC